MKLRSCALRGCAVLVLVPLVLVAALLVGLRLANRTNGSLQIAGETRRYLLHRPPGLDPARPVPLVISLHGAGGWPAQQRDTSGWDRVADQEGFLVVYPAGRGIPRIWAPDPGPALQEDLRFLGDLMDELARKLPVDRRRIYVDGLSNGGNMAYALACARPDRIAAVGMVAAARTLPLEACPDPGPIPVLAFHGTADPIIPFQGGPSRIAPPEQRFPDVAAWTAAVARRNRCGGTPSTIRLAPDVTRLAYEGDGNSAPVELCVIEGGGHTWPGGKPLPRWMCGPTSRSVDATRLLWAFFKAHPKAEP